MFKTENPNVQNIDVQQLQKWMKHKEIVLIDVREPAEFESFHIAESQSIPLSEISDNIESLKGNAHAAFICLTGNRSKIAASIVKQEFGTSATVYNISGGIATWKKVGFPVTGSSTGFPVMRQVHIVAGLIALVSTTLAWFNVPYAILGAMFVGYGLLFSGLTGWCMMSMLLKLLPWNKGKSTTVLN